MRYRRTLSFIIIICTAVVLCLGLSGCGKSPEKPVTEETPADQTAPAGQTAPAVKEAPAPPRVVTLDAGTPIAVVTSSTLSTKSNQSGEAFQASLNQDIVDGDWIIAKRGAPVAGVITNSDPGGKVKGVASITISLSQLNLADGSQVSIKTNSYSRSASSTKKKDAAKIGIGAGVGAAIGAIAGGGKGAAIGAGVGGAAGTGAVLATRGDPATIPSETAITFKLAMPLEVTQKK